jgi:hypothetical protein
MLFTVASASISWNPVSGPQLTLVRDRHFGVTTSPDLSHLTHPQMT